MQLDMKNLFLMLLLATAVTLGVAAGGNQEQNGNENETESQDRGTPIEIEEGAEIETTPDQEPSASNDSNGDSQEDGHSDPERTEIRQPAWTLFFHDGREGLQKQVSTTVDRGYLPVGLEINPDGTFTTLYLYSPNELPDRWLLESYSVNEDVDSIVSARILDGWLPLAFTVYDATLAFMYGRGGAEIDDWRVHRSSLDAEEITQTLVNYQSQDYAFVDIGIDDTDDTVWYLFVKQDGRLGGPDTRFFVNAYPNGESVPNGISKDYEDGRGFPMGFATGSAISIVVFGTQTD